MDALNLENVIAPTATGSEYRRYIFKSSGSHWVPAENKTIAAIKRREQQANAKIKAAEASMLAELRERAAVLAVATATEVITGKLDKEAGLALVDSAATEIEKLN